MQNDMRDRLTTSIENAKKLYEGDVTDLTETEYVAECLLSEGVILPPCNVGDTIYYLHITCDSDGKEYGEIVSGEIVSLSIDNRNKWVYARYNGGLTMWHIFEDFGYVLFFTKDQAEQKLKELSDKV